MTPYLSSGSAVSVSGSAVAVEDIPAEGDTIVAEKVDPESLTHLVKDTWVDISQQGYQRILYAFTAEKDGCFTVEKKNTSNMQADFYTTGLDGLEAADDPIRLAAGETCIVVVQGYGEASFRLVETEEPEEPGEPTDPDLPQDPPVTEDSLELSEGLYKIIDFQTPGQVLNATFTPKEDGWYRIYSADYPEEWPIPIK